MQEAGRWNRRHVSSGSCVLAFALLACAGVLLLPAVASARRVTELVSKPPPGIVNLGVCAENSRHTFCHSEVNRDATSIIFQAAGLEEWSAGVTQHVGPLACRGRTERCEFAISDDGTHVFWATLSPVTPDDADVHYLDVYERSEGVTKLISSSDPSGGNGPYDADLVFNSRDGSRVIFSLTDCSTVFYSCGGPSAGDWERVGDEIRPFPSAFARHLTWVHPEGASPDGGRVFFTTDEPLVSADTDGGCADQVERYGCDDIYERTATGAVKLISTGPGRGTGPIFAYFLDATEDGSHVFFEAGAPLLGDGSDPHGGQYEWVDGSLRFLGDRVAFDAVSHDGTRVFITTGDRLASEDTDDAGDIYELSGGHAKLISRGPTSGNGPYSARFRGISEDGSHVFFETEEALTPDEQPSCHSAYYECWDVYERVGDTTRRVSVGPIEGTERDGAFYAGASADGSRVFFHSTSPYVQRDTDSCIGLSNWPGCEDVYERYRGRTTLVSTGPTDPGTRCFDNCTEFLAASPDGTRVFFATEDRLVKEDTDEGNDIYLSRVASCHPKKQRRTC